jgi:flavin-binding protein dodecin
VAPGSSVATHLPVEQTEMPRRSRRRPCEGSHEMSIARVSEIIARSKVSFDDALQQGVARAHKTLKNVRSVWIHDQSVDIEKGKIVAYKLSLKVTFVLND